MSKSISSHRVPTSQTRAAFRAFGKDFPFIQIGDDGHVESKNAAHRAAEQHGLEVIAELQRQKGDIPLTHREVLRGKVNDTLPVQKEFKSLTPAERDPNSNPYLSLLADLNERPGSSPQERAVSDKRRVRYESLSMEWQTKRDAQVELDRRSSDPQVGDGNPNSQAAFVKAIENGGNGSTSTT